MLSHEGSSNRTKVKKRTRTLLNKANDLAKIDGANVYVLITYQRENVVYNSSLNKEWPPPDRNLEQQYEVLKRENPETMQAPKCDSDLHELKRLLDYFATRAELLRPLTS